MQWSTKSNTLSRLRTFIKENTYSARGQVYPQAKFLSKSLLARIKGKYPAKRPQNPGMISMISAKIRLGLYWKDIVADRNV